MTTEINKTTKREIESRGEKIIKIGEEKTYCPRCEDAGKNAVFIKTENFFILDCSKCGFSMGTPRNG